MEKDYQKRRTATMQYPLKLFFLFFLFCYIRCFTTEKEILIYLKEENIKFDENDENYLFYIPSFLTTDQDGNVYVVDSGNNRIQVFSTKGNFIRSIGRKGEGPSEFFHPAGAYIKGNLIYISDAGNRRIQVFETSGNFKKSIKLNFSPTYLSVNKKGEIYVGKLINVADPSPEFLIKIISQEGREIGEFHKSVKTKDRVLNDLLNYVLIAMDSKENIIVAHEFLKNSISKYNQKGELLFEFKTLLKPKGPFMKIGTYDLIGYTEWITCGFRDEIYLLSYKFVKDKKDFIPGNEIYRFNSSGKYEDTLILPFDAKIIATDKWMHIFAIDAEDRLRKCSIPKH